MRRAQQSNQYNDVITLDTYSEEAESCMADWIIFIMLKKRGGRAMTNQQLADAFRQEPAILLSDGVKIMSYLDGLKLDQQGRYVQKIPVKFNMQTAAKVGVQREHYNWCTMDAVIAHIPGIDIKPTQYKDGRWGFTASLLPDAEREAIRVLKVCEAVKRLRDVPVNFKTELCKFHSGKYGCVNGGRCHFAHSKEELRNATPPPLTQPSPPKPATPSRPTRAPWFQQDKSESLHTQLPRPTPASPALPAPPARWFPAEKRDASY
jgi:hypothetical protein